MNVSAYFASLGIREEHFRLEQTHFDRESHLHGIAHTYRVMTHCLVLGAASGYHRESLIAFCGAFIHDMARQNDGRCEYHGQWAAERKLHQHSKRFFSEGITDGEVSVIAEIVTGHSLPGDVQVEKKNIPLAILKDADALDRIRLGEGNLKPEFLRLSQSGSFIGYAQALYCAATERASTCSFEEYLALSSALLRGVGSR
ncbi:MAG: hypothetical protein FD164_2045 [Nitrospirae bacterium]|nr:MAG: hypothetical protein FD164_2045 [Nitrospirota bacterium]